MVFLKKFHAEGFKSFAKPVTLNFNSTMIGIVGPNGSGKSNIVDALKWAMGEQSIKSLRGKEKSNLIFAGSNDLKEADFALVELTFDNSTKILHCDSEEVKISRKLIKKTGETIYSLNDEPCLLKDIQTIFVDSGLGKGSLGIISQGSVNWFAEAKPEDRRQMFESAAGIGKYIKQKNETTDHLEKATANLEKLSITLNSLRRDVKELQKQAEKAKIYKEKTEQLKVYDISVSVQDYLTWKDEIVELEAKLSNEKDELETLKSTVEKARELNSEFQEKFLAIDSKIKDLNKERIDITNQISDLNVKWATYIANLENKLSTGTIEERKESYKLIIASEEEKNASWVKQLEETKVEYSQITNTLAELKSKEEEYSSKESSIKNSLIQKKFRYEELLKQKQNSNSHERGVEELLKVKNRIGGIHSTVQNLINVKERYEVAIQTALGKSMNNLIVDSDDIAVKCINYLKQNRCGRATFLPLNTIKGKEIPSQTLTIMSQVPGFVGVANSLIEYDPKYSTVISSILGNVGVADNIDNANVISKMIKSTYKIISLDGDVVFAGGALAGGQTYHNKQVFFNLEEKIQKAEEEYFAIKSEYDELSVNLTKIEQEISSYEVKKQMNESLLDKIENNLQNSTQKINQNKIELEALDVDVNDEKNKAKVNQFELDLIQLNEQLNKVEKELKESERLKELSHDQVAKYSTEYNSSQAKENALIKLFSDHKSRFDNLNNNVNNIEDRIVNTYGLTMETAISNYNKPLDITISEAKQIISSLKAEINALGNINFQALESLESKESELQELEKETNDVKESVNSLTELLISLDKRAKENFIGVINRVNEIIPKVFKSLFGGGHCEIKIVDPQNVLESGIDVIAQPPGKKITNLVLFSGGEKTLIALAVLFSLLKSSRFPLVLLDEAEAALDQANVNTFAKLIQEFSDSCQFLVITHRTGTMKMCDVLYGTMMKVKGVTNVLKVDFDSIKNKGQENKG